MKKILLINLVFASLYLFANQLIAQTTVNYDFSSSGAESGLNESSPGITVDPNIGFASFRNSGTSNPVINNGQLRLYQDPTKGGSIIIYANNGVIITDVVINASVRTGNAGFSVDGGSSISVSGGSTYTINGITASNNVEFFQAQSNSGNRVYVDSFNVTYSSSGANLAPSITNLNQNPLSPTSMEDVVVTATITDDSNVNTATIQYGFSSGAYNQMPITMTNTNGNEYQGTIPMQANNTTVFYVVRATDDDMTTPLTTDSAEQSYTVNNPVMTNNIAIQDFDNSGPLWNYTTSITPFGNPTNGNGDFYGEFLASDIIELDNPNFAANIFAENDLNNNNGGTSGFATMTFQDVDVTGFDFVTLSFDYQIVDYNSSNDDAEYEVFLDGTGQGSIFIVDGGNDPADNSGTITFSVPIGTTTLGLEISIRNDGGSGFSGFDNFKIAGSRNYVYDGTSWSPTAPEGNSTTLDDILVQSGSYTFTADLDVRDLDVDTNGSLNLGANTVNVTGDFLSLGIVTADEATLNLAGTAAQSVLVPNLTVENLIINNANGASLDDTVNLEGVLSLTNGALTSNNNLTFKSSNAKSAIIDEVISGSISGNVIIEQFYPANRAFRFVSLPVDLDGSILSNYQQDGLNPGDTGYQPGIGTQITGGTAADGFDQSGTNNPSMFTFNNATQVWEAFSTANGDATNVTSAAYEPGFPVRLNVRGDRSISLTATGAAAAATDTRLVVTGSVTTGDVPYPSLSTVAGEFNFIGNPYQAQVNVETMVNDPLNADIRTDAHIGWDPTLTRTQDPNVLGRYVAYDYATDQNTVMGSAMNEFIQPGQSFFTNTVEDGDDTGSLSPVLTFRESYKTDSPITTATYSAPQSPVDFIKVALFNNADTGAIARDGALIKFTAAGNNAYDNADILKLPNPAENLSVVSNNNSTMINSRALPVNGDVINLNSSNYSGTAYSIKVDNAYNGFLELYLIDALNGTATLMNSGMNTYNFTVDVNNPVSIDTSRFSLEFSNTTLGLNDSAFAKAVFISPNPATASEIVLHNMESDSVEVTLYNTSGQLILNKTITAQGNTATITELDTLTNGVYLLQVTTQNTNQTLRVILNN